MARMLPLPAAAKNTNGHSAQGTQPETWDSTVAAVLLDMPATNQGGYGMPADRQARLAARRAFMALKMSFLHALDHVPCNNSGLRTRVRRAEEAHELWNLRGEVFATLSGDNPSHRSLRQLLTRSLDTMFPTQPQSLN